MLRCVAFLALALFVSPVAAQPVSPDIVVVRAAGPWETASDRGFSRLVGQATGGQLALSIEWISDSGSVVKAMRLPMVPGAENLALASMRGESGPVDSAVYFDTSGGDTFVLVVGAPGEARFGPATN